LFAFIYDLAPEIILQTHQKILLLALQFSYQKSSYALMYKIGYENTDPVKFGIRAFACLLTANYIAFLAQDVLNLNNQIVHNIGQMKFTFEPLKDADGK
jgi:hypothetical protein